MSVKDRYIKDVIERGDEGSAFLAAKCAPTLKNCEYVDVLREGMNGLAVLRIPQEYCVVVHSACGDPSMRFPHAYAASLVNELYSQARRVNATPVGFADVIDARVGDRALIEELADGMIEIANYHKLAIMNGELAILGDRLNCDANMNGTMISISPKGSLPHGLFERGGCKYCVFNQGGMAVYMNSDGVGTKTEFYERAGLYGKALDDSAAMKADDGAKNGAIINVMFDTVETSGYIPRVGLDGRAEELSRILGAAYLLNYEDVGNRLRGWRDGEPAFNVSGSAVSVIDENRLRNPPTPQAGDHIMAIKGKPNPRSNGITDKRRIMVKMFGENWHETREGKIFMEFLAEPSVVFYPVFNELIENGAATSVYHMSGGAYNGKLARPLAKHGLYAALENIFPADWRELAIAGFSLTPAEAAYAKWPMGNDGFITTQNPYAALGILGRHRLLGRIVGKVEDAQDDMTGVTLVGIKGSDGKDVYFPGK